MKKATVILFVVMLSVSLYAVKPEKLLKKVYNNNSKIITVDASYFVNKGNYIKATKKTEQSKVSKRILIKKPEKMKIITFDADTAQKKDEKIFTEQVEIGLFPDILFNLEQFLEGFDLSITQKDERIKMGKEEIVAIKKGQTMLYPQVRIIILNERVQEIKFYSIIGKKYYEIVVNEYKKIKSVDIPVKITEKLYANKNEITNTITYKEVILNEEISDQEFE